MSSVSILLDAVRSGGQQADDAARTLGLLIEREKVRRPAGDDGGLGLFLDEEWLEHRLGPQELQEAVDGLTDYVTHTSVPIPSAVWALGKSYEPRIVPPLIDLLRRVLPDEDLESLAYQALTGIIDASPGTAYEMQALTAVQDAAHSGHGSVSETANAYLLLRN